MKKIKTYFGFTNENKIDVKYLDNFDFTDNLDLKLDYLKILDDQENDRHSSIETKTSQLIGQTGIIFSLIGLFISNYLTKFDLLPMWVRAFLIMLFLASLIFYLITIFHSTKYLNVKKYRFGRRSVSTVSKKYDNCSEFKIEEIKDVIYSIERNTLVTNQKCEILMYAYRSFIAGTVSVGILSILLIFAGSFVRKSEAIKVNIERPISIAGMDSLIIPLVNNGRNN